MAKFQSNTKKLPAEMRSWTVYANLNQRFYNFIETMPLSEV
jgi:hypothetical protein